MKPGRELDALIAENVFGEDQTSRDVDLSHTIPHIGRVFVPYVPRPYSTDIAAAWEVVEKIRDDNFSLQEHGTHWKVHFGVVWAGAETAPHAICLAALRAVTRE